MPCESVQSDKTRRRSVYQRIQQTPGTAISTEVPGVSDWKASQVDEIIPQKHAKFRF